MSNPQENERRDTFRMEMDAYLTIAKKQQPESQPIDYFRDLEALALTSEFDAVKQEIGQVSERIKDLSTKKSIELLSSQLDILSKLKTNQILAEQSLISQKISISEGGCSATLSDSVNIGDELALAIVFTPSYFSLFVFAEVITITPVQNRFKVHFKFVELTERQKQTLLKHMFQAQTDAKKSIS